MKNRNFKSETYVKLPNNRGCLKHTKETQQRDGSFYADSELIEILPVNYLENFKITFKELKIPFQESMSSLLVDTYSSPDNKHKKRLIVYGDFFKYTCELNEENDLINRSLVVDFGWLPSDTGKWVIESIHGVRDSRDSEGWYYVQHEDAPLKLKTVSYSSIQENPPGALLATARSDAILRYENKSRKSVFIDISE